MVFASSTRQITNSVKCVSNTTPQPFGRVMMVFDDASRFCTHSITLFFARIETVRRRKTHETPSTFLIDAHCSPVENIITPITVVVVIIIVIVLGARYRVTAAGTQVAIQNTHWLSKANIWTDNDDSYLPPVHANS